MNIYGQSGELIGPVFLSEVGYGYSWHSQLVARDQHIVHDTVLYCSRTHLK